MFCFLQLIGCLVAASMVAVADEVCERLEPAPRNFSHLGPEWTGRCAVLYVSLSARTADGAVCGTDVFSADSDLVTAAIHAGLFSGYSFASSTIVSFLPGRQSYQGASRFGIASKTCGSARLSFTFRPDQFPLPPAPHELTFYSGMLASFSVTGRSPGGRVVGGHGGVYAQLSDPGAAAVHSGLLRPGETRVLRLWYLPLHPGFSGASRNGISTESNLETMAAFGFPDTRMFWGEAPHSLDEFRGADAATMSFRLTCGTRPLTSVRGTDVYVVGSNFAASAVHAGVIRPGETRVVEVEFVGKRDRFRASYRNGVMSKRAGRDDGYRFLSAKIV